ncbi:MAG: dicarboxylate/amino acid:cation symporter [Muribaculaceae bacterium]|nr:dicarboxylate/amino acid:cation symporter [Muribaculaceae bacterium]
MKGIKIGLLARIVIAIALGVGAGCVLPEWLARIFVTFNSIFSEFLGFMVPLIIVGFVAPAIADIGKAASRMLLLTVVLAYTATLFSGFFSYFSGLAIFPSMITEGVLTAQPEGGAVLAPYFTVAVPPLMSVMTALVLAFAVGIGSAQLSSVALRNVMSDFRDVVNFTIVKAVIPLLPVYIFGIFMNMTVSGQVGQILLTFVRIFAVIFFMHVVVLVFQYCVAALFDRENPFRRLGTMLPAYFTALGTQSSAATIPVTLRQTVKMGVKSNVAGFVIPLCATIHMSGSTLKIVACALALMMSGGMDCGLMTFAGFICMLGITIVAAPGVPGGAIMASLGLLSSMLGFTDADNALMIALYIAMDSFGTACNVTGDGAIALIVNRFFGARALR